MFGIAFCKQVKRFFYARRLLRKPEFLLVFFQFFTTDIQTIGNTLFGTPLFFRNFRQRKIVIEIQIGHLALCSGEQRIVSVPNPHEFKIFHIRGSAYHKPERLSSNFTRQIKIF